MNASPVSDHRIISALAESSTILALRHWLDRTRDRKQTATHSYSFCKNRGTSCFGVALGEESDWSCMPALGFTNETCIAMQAEGQTGGVAGVEVAVGTRGRSVFVSQTPAYSCLLTSTMTTSASLAWPHTLTFHRWHEHYSTFQSFLELAWTKLERDCLQHLDLSPVHGHRSTLLFLVLCCTSFVAASVLWYYICRRPTRTLQRTREALSAMLTVLTPVHSLWPARYVSIARSTQSDETVINIPLETLVCDVIEGVVELRNPRVNLPLLFQTGYPKGTMRIRLDTEWFWWFRLLRWLLCSAFSSTPISEVS